MYNLLLDILCSIISGVVSGIIASVILNQYYWNKKPKLLLSDYIAKNSNNEYRLKIINKSKFYVTNIFIQVQLVTVTNGNGGSILNVQNLDIPYKMLHVINPYKKDDLNCNYAVRFAISKNLEEIWKDDQHTYLKLIIHCSNEHNNASKLYEKIYYKKSKCIKNGEFKAGDSIEVE